MSYYSLDRQVRDMERMMRTSGLRTALRILRELDDLERSVVEPVRQYVQPVWRTLEPAYSLASLYTESLSVMFNIDAARYHETMLSDLRRIERPLRQLLSSLPVPPPLKPVEQDARKAWERFSEGDPEPLDFFIRERLGLWRNEDRPPPNELRQRLWELLDDCFNRVPFYSPGEWFMLDPAEEEELIELVREGFHMFPSHKRALSRDGVSPYQNLPLELRVVLTIAWDELRRGETSSTLLNRASTLLRSGDDEADKLIKVAQKRPHIFLSDDVDDSLTPFETQEVARQQVEALESLVEKARFSETERLVFEFDSRIGTDFETKAEATKAAARALQVETGTVRGFRKRYRDKLPEAAGN